MSPDVTSSLAPTVARNGPPGASGAPLRIWADLVRARLDTVVVSGRWRQPREFDAFGPEGTLGGAPVVSFASNDYLGLSAHPAVVTAAIEALRRWGAGAGASRLVTGSRPVHTE